MQDISVEESPPNAWNPQNYNVKRCPIRDSTPMKISIVYCLLVMYTLPTLVNCATGLEIILDFLLIIF